MTASYGGGFRIELDVVAKHGGGADCGPDGVAVEGSVPRDNRNGSAASTSRQASRVQRGSRRRGGKGGDRATGGAIRVRGGNGMVRGMREGAPSRWQRRSVGRRESAREEEQSERRDFRLTGMGAGGKAEGETSGDQSRLIQ
ncbi:hypothetical protein OsJ_11466 [Oryza sativa Japonica Group]|uniref:Uncharacterized protein n=2 Tax=Oryza sativa subsp. japonica TaxID=39947 RepID=A0A979HJ99_ORYSJ|nr:hypothetical protein [Oryza sativa Japonica Group]ABF97155.1 hypothetical protein LOC_Os03g36810 [Oryza sativa Japonica Group]EAZ27515.1 hypothetical protein OsJ_11466 [Oryza sativa Japonica Group]